MDRDEIAAKELKRRKDFSLSASIVPSLNFQPSTINSGDQREVMGGDSSREAKAHRHVGLIRGEEPNVDSERGQPCPTALSARPL